MNKGNLSAQRIMMVMLLGIMLIPMISAAEWDNVQDYDEETKTLTVTNALGLGERIADIQLTTPLKNTVLVGQDIKVAELHFENYDDYDNVFKEMEFFDINEGLDPMTKAFTYKYKQEIEIDVPIRENQCVYDAVNKNDSCEYKIIGYNKEKAEQWITIDTKNTLLKGNITVGIFTDTSYGDYIEWIPTWYGERITEWASYSATEFNASHSYPLDEGPASRPDTDYYGMKIRVRGNSSTILLRNVTKPPQNTADSCEIEDASHTTLKIAAFTGAYCNVNWTLTNNTVYYIETYSSSGNWDLPYNTDDPPSFPENTTYISWERGVDQNDVEYTNRAYSIESIIVSPEAAVAPDNPPTVTLNSPTNATNFSTDTVTFNWTVTDDYNVTNYTFYLSNGSIETTTFGTGNETGRNLTITNFADGSYQWNVTADDNVSQRGNSSLYNFTIDTTAPTIVVAVPGIGTTTDDYVTSNYRTMELNWSVSDAGVGLDTCRFYNITSAANQTNTCGQNQTFNDTYGTYTFLVYANDTVGNDASASTPHTFDYKILENSNTFDATVAEGQSTEFILNLSSNDAQTVLAVLDYNNTEYATTKSGDNSEMTFSVNLTPTDIGTHEFFWNVSYGSSYFNSSTNNQTVSDLNMTNCSGGGTVILNFTVVDEETQVEINETRDNLTIWADFDIINPTTGATVEEFYEVANETNPYAICVNNNTLSSDAFRLDGSVKYESDPRVAEFYYIQNTSLTDTSVPINITLYDLLTADAQEFKVTYKDENFLGVRDALIQVQRQYIGEGLFKTVEQPKTDASGETLANLVLGDEVYTFVVTKNGETLATFANRRAVCDNAATGDCQINLNSFSSSVPIENFVNLEGISFTLDYNTATRLVRAIFSVTDGTTQTVQLNVTKFDAFMNTSVCNDSLTSSSGTLSCTVPATFSNATVIGRFSKVGSIIPLGKIIIPLYENPEDLYGPSFMTLAVISFLTLVGLGLGGGSAIALAFFVTLGLIVNSSMLFISKFSYIGAGAVFMWFAIVIAVIMFKASRRNSG